MRLLLLVLIVFFSQNIFCQADNPELSKVASRKNAIQHILKSEKTKLADSVVASYYLELAELDASEFDYGASVLYCDSILKGFPKLDFYKRMGIEEQKALYLRELGKTEQAMEIFLRILRAFEDRKDFRESADLNKRIGIIFLKMDDWKNAEYHLKESVDYARKVGDKEIEGYALMSLGNRFKGENKYKEAENYYKESIAIAKAQNIQRLLAGNYNNYGSLMRMMNKYGRALEFFKLAVEINKATGNEQWLSYNYNNLGTLNQDQGNYSEALRYFSLSINLKEKLGDLRGKVQTLLNVAQVYEKLKNYQEACKFHRLYNELNDSVSKLDHSEQNKRLAAEFQSDKREAEIGKLSMQAKLNDQAIKSRDERISYQNFVAWILSIGVLIILVIAMLLWRTTISRKRINKQLIVKNAQIDLQHNEIIDSINYAKRIQNSILPVTEDMRAFLGDFALIYQPKDIVSGDFYVCEQAHGFTYFGTVDCTGHGVPGAMVSLVASSHLNRMLREFKLSEPGKILTQLNAEIPSALAKEDQSINDGMDMALCAMDQNRTQLHFAGAHQNCWIVNSKESLERRIHPNLHFDLHGSDARSILELKGDRQGIGKSSESTEFITQHFALEVGDIILLSSDGYRDQFGGPNNKKFKVSEMRRLLLESGAKNPEEIKSLLQSALHQWQGSEEQVDDICVLVVKI